MSEQRLSLLVAGGGILCLLLQLIVSLTDNPAKRAQAVSHEVAYKSVKLRAEKRAARLSPRLAQALSEGNRKLIESELERTMQADPEIVEVGIVDQDAPLTVIACSDPARATKPLTGPAAEIVRESLAAGRIPRSVDARADQRVLVAQPLVHQKAFMATLYMVLNTASVEDDLGQVILAMAPPRVPVWLTIGLGLVGLSVAIGMMLSAERKQQLEAVKLQEVVEQMGMGHFDARLDPADVPHHAGVAERLNAMAEQVQLLQQAQAEDSEHASRMAQELQDAQVVQQTLMPEVRRIARGPLQMCGVYRSASKLSGDWWNHFQLDEHRTLLVLADVVGHGIGSAVVGAMAYGCASQLYQESQGNLRPEMILTRLNETICATTRGKFTMSCFAVIIDTRTGTLTFASGAQAFPLLFRPNDSNKPFIPLVATGSPLGSSRESKFEANTQAFGPGDMLICYTDGLIEAANPGGDQFGDKRVRQTVQRNASRNVEEICEALLAEVGRFVGTAELEDDQTLVVARNLTSAAAT
jgi:serine phosphatase RsbU (regulator of sigma subunit)